MNKIYLLTRVVLFLYCAPVFAMQDIANPEPTFLERHWWEFIIFFTLCAISFAHLEEDRTTGAWIFFIIAMGYLIYDLIQYI